MTPALRRLVLGGALALSAAGHAAAETRTIRGSQLVLTSTLGSDVRITIDPTLSHSMRVSSQEDLSCLTMTEGPTAAIGTSACGGDIEDLQVAIPPDAPVTLTVSGGGDLLVGDLRAPLTAVLTGGGDIKAGTTGPLILSLSGGGDVSVGTVNGPASLQLAGSGDVRLAALNGPLNVRHAGRGDLAVGSISADAVALEDSGSGDTLIGGGRIAVLNVHMNGAGDLAIAATVGGGAVAASGGGDVRLGQVTGPLVRSARDGSDITVGGSAVVDGIIADVAKAIGQSDELPGKHGETVAVHSTSIVTHLVMAAVVAVTLFLVWRIVRRGAFGARGGRSAPDRPLHPGVVAVSEAMSRLEQRLGRMESYVTTREFDLNRKFRDLR